MYTSDIKEIIVSEKEIIKKSQELGVKLTEIYKDKNPILIGLLKGSIPFMAELMKHIKISLEIDFMDVSSYIGVASGELNILKDLDSSIKGRNVLIVEDIIDTGRTLLAVSEHLKNKGAKEIKTIALLDKPSRRVVDIHADYIGFEIPDYFVVGYGLDFNQKYRNLPFVGILKEELYK
ncbi:MAG: hypoxanthine phosphoribosyltransferase [Erysipelotrichaceae bacterium]